MSEPGYTETSGRDGIIECVDEDCFSVRHRSNTVQLYDLAELSDCDRVLAIPGAAIRYSEGVLVTADGHKSRVATIRFKGDDNVDNT